MARSLWDKLTGAVTMDDQIQDDDSQMFDDNSFDNGLSSFDEPEDGELAVDVYDTGDTIIVKTMTAGVKKANLEIEISREEVTIRGERHEENEGGDTNYHHRELYWGGFSRTIILPDEIDIDEAEATEDHGLVTLILPKIHRDRKAQLKIK
ncbi:MAG: Hsp20/alpha crystallin family protein [Candidatus Nomurabacteria bacterium]|nr:Hsp20/alpha crystallin family protein [Candidatus Nomurabacteria bacterium]